MAGLDDIYDEVVDKIATPKERLLLVETLKKEGKPQAVIQACKKVLEIFPDDLHIRRLLAETYFDEGSLDLAEMELNKIAQQIKDLSYIFKFLSELLIRKNKIDDAIYSLRLYLAHNQGDQDAADLLAEISQPGEEQSAFPTSTLAELYYKQGQLDEAIKVYEQVVASFPADEKAKHRLSALKGEKRAQEGKMETTRSARERQLKLLGVLEKWLAAVEQRKMEALQARA
jgi:tetratricopeptide (TPR) repeat protein